MRWRSIICISTAFFEPENEHPDFEQRQSPGWYQCGCTGPRYVGFCGTGGRAPVEAAGEAL